MKGRVQGSILEVMDPLRSIVRLPDGRFLDVLVGGAESSRAFLMINGTPAGVVARDSDMEAIAARGLRYVTYGRPGYGDSTRVPGRSVADAAPDIRALAEALGLSRLYVLGWSGGGPHALAAAALLPDLVASTATVGGVAPFRAEGLDWLDGMGQENIDEFGATLAGAAELEAFLSREAASIAGVTGASVAEYFGGLVPEVDRGALTDAFAEFMAESMRDAVRTGIWGWFDDDVAFAHDWGFDLGSIHGPVTIWQGTEDKMVPFAHGRWLAGHVPGARPRLMEGEGHLSLAVSSFERILDELVDADPSGIMPPGP
jgi:pimeloyl-ACP methyl ester carboxylesterase